MSIFLAQIKEAIEPILKSAESRGDTAFMLIIIAGFVLAVVWIQNRHMMQLRADDSKDRNLIRQQFTDYIAAADQRHNSSIDSLLHVSQNVKHAVEGMQTIAETNRQIVLAVGQVIQRLNGGGKP